MQFSSKAARRTGYAMLVSALFAVPLLGHTYDRPGARPIIAVNTAYETPHPVVTAMPTATPAPEKYPSIPYAGIEPHCEAGTPTPVPTTAPDTASAASVAGIRHSERPAENSALERVPRAVSTPANAYSQSVSPGKYDIKFAQKLSNACGISAHLPVEKQDLPDDVWRHHVRAVAVSNSAYLSQGDSLEVGWVDCNYRGFDLPCGELSLFVAEYKGRNMNRTVYDIPLGDDVEVAITNSISEDPYVWHAMVRDGDNWLILYTTKMPFKQAPRAIEMDENYSE